MAHELSDVDEQILDILGEGRGNPSYLADRVGETRQYVHQRLQLLVAADLVENIGHGLYERTLEVISDGGTVPKDDGDYPLECVCGRVMIDIEDAHGHIMNCDELGSD